MSFIGKLTAALALGLAFGAAASAQNDPATPKLLGKFDQWEAYAYVDGGEKVCYMGSRPTSEKGDYKLRGTSYMLVTHRPGIESFNTVSLHAGYTYKQDSSVSVAIGGTRFDLFTHKDTAWANDEQADLKLIGSMKKGADMVIEGTSSRGTLTTDRYSLIGFTRAHKTIGDACSVPRAAR